jgi:di/tricarboxylate transporter
MTRETDRLLGDPDMLDDDTVTVADEDGRASHRSAAAEVSAGSLWRRHRSSALAAVVSLGVFVTICLVDLGFGKEEYKTQAPAQRCLAMLGLVALLWASETIPAHVTSLLVPLLSVVLRVLCVPRHVRERSETDTLLVPAYTCNSTHPGPGQPMPASAAASVAVGAFFNPIILLFLAGFSMSIVFDQRGISHWLAAALLRPLGSSPATVGLGLMTCCVVASAVLGNVSAAVIATSLLRPTLEDENIQRTSWPRFSLLGVAYASNIGGMLSPVSSPQNLIAMMAIQTAAMGATLDDSKQSAAGGGGLSFGAW